MPPPPSPSPSPSPPQTPPPPPPDHQSGSAIKPIDETTPLLSLVEPLPLAEPSEASNRSVGSPSTSTPQGQSEDEDEAEDEDEPLPRAQIFLLCYTACVAPIAFFSIFPYINFMIESVGDVNKEDVGFYSGLIESLFSATQMCVMIAWGRASDRFGRKPVLVVSLLGMTVASTLFGLSQRLWQMVLFRCVAGVFGGTIVTVRAMLSEISTKRTQARAFSFFAFAGNMGIFIGPLLGGALERPASKFPSTFGKAKFWHDYPYALPNIVVSAIALSAAMTTILFVRETLHRHDTDAKKTTGPPMSTWELLKQPGVAAVLVIYNYIMLIAFAHTAVLPVTQYTPISLGGYGFSPEQIAAFTGSIGAAQAAWLLLIFPPLHRRVGTGRVLWWCAIGWPLFSVAVPSYNVLRRYDLNIVFWVTGPPVLLIASGVAMAFTAVQLALNDISPSHETLGTLNAICIAATSGVRAIAPAVATSIYAIGVKYHILGGQLFWVCQAVLTLGLAVLLKWLPDKARGPGKTKQTGTA